MKRWVKRTLVMFLVLAMVLGTTQTTVLTHAEAADALLTQNAETSVEDGSDGSEAYAEQAYAEQAYAEQAYAEQTTEEETTEEEVTEEETTEEAATEEEATTEEAAIEEEAATEEEATTEEAATEEEEATTEEAATEEEAVTEEETAEETTSDAEEVTDTAEETRVAETTQEETTKETSTKEETTSEKTTTVSLTEAPEEGTFGVISTMLLSIASLDDGIMLTADADETTVVAMIGETGYATVTAALEAVADSTETTITLLADVTEDITISGVQNIVLDLDGNTLTGTITVSSSNALTIQNGSIIVDAQAGIVIESSTTVTLNDVSITVQGATGSHRAGIYVKDGYAAALTLEGTNSITGKDLPEITKDASTDVIGIWIGGTPSDSSASSGGASLTITGSGSLSINEVGTGISNTATNSLTISGTTVTMTDIYMLDSTVSGMGIYNNGTLTVSNGATLAITNVNNDNLSGTYISYKNGYGIASQNEGGVTITGSGTTVNITGAYLSGIYCSDKTDSTTDNYLTVSDGAKLTIDGGSTSTASQHAGIKMESNGTISVTGGAVVDISSTIYGIAVNADCLVEVDGSGSKINIHDLATHGEKQNKEQGIYAGANTIINVKNSGDLSVEGANYAIVFEVGTSGEDGIFVTDNGTLNITNSDLGIYVQGGTTSVEFTNKADVNITVNSVAIGSDANAPTGHILMSGEGTTVDLNGDWVFSMNYKYLKIADNAVVNVTATSEAISLGSWKNDGGDLIVTSGAKLTMNIEGDYSGIATYGTSHYVEFSDGAEVYIAGTGYGMSLSKPTTVYVSDATLVIENENGIVASGTGNLLYEDSLSHIEATNVYTTGDGALDFIVMGGTLTYNFNHENNVWPYNATGITIGEFVDGAFKVNEIAPVRSITYTKDEALVNFIVPSDEDHLTFGAVYQTLTDTYSYQSDAAKEGNTLSIWVPGVEVYYNFDEDTDLVNTNLTRKYVDDLEKQGVVFELQYEDITEPYDMVIRGQSIEFSAESVTEDAITLKYARLKNDAIVDHVLTDEDGIPALYTTSYTASDGKTYSIQWYYGNTTLFGTDEKIDNGPLTAFDSTSSVTRLAAANVYGILSTADTSTPGATDFDLSKSKEATQLELQEDGTLTSDVTISLPSASYTGDLDVVFVLDGSTSTDEDDLAAQAAALLESLLEYENLNVKAGVIIFGGSVPILYNSDLVTLDETTCATLTDKLTDSSYDSVTGRSGSNLQAGVETARTLLNNDTDVDSSDKYMIILSDGAARMWYDSDSGEAVSQTYVPDSTIFWNSNEDWIRRYDSTSSIFEPLSFAEIWAAGQNGADIDAYAMTKSQYEAASVGDEGIASWNTVTTDPDYYTTYEAATYYAATSIVEVSSESNVIFVSYPYHLGTTYGDYIDSFQTWLANVVTRYDSSEADAETIFSAVKDQLIQLVDAGSVVVDEIGETDDYDFDFINDIDCLTLTVDGMALAVTQIDEYSYGFGVKGESSDGTTYPFVLTYYPDGTTYDGTAYNECFVLEINVPITKNDQVKLTYSVVLTNPQTETGTYGTYDQYGDNNDGSEGYDLYTNNVARLYPVDSNGNSLSPEDFQKPTVSYTVTPTEEPTPTPTEEETTGEETTEAETTAEETTAEETTAEETTAEETTAEETTAEEITEEETTEEETTEAEIAEEETTGEETTEEETAQTTTTAEDDSSDDSSDSVGTGDSTSPGTFALIAVVSLLCLVLLIVAERKRRRSE